MRQLRLCTTCKGSFKLTDNDGLSIPDLCVLNDLELAPIPPELKALNPMEVRPISKVVPFATVLVLPKGQSKIKGCAIALPFPAIDLVEQLPRCAMHCCGVLTGPLPNAPLQMCNRWQLTGVVMQIVVLTLMLHCQTCADPRLRAAS